MLPLYFSITGLLDSSFIYLITRGWLLFKNPIMFFIIFLSKGNNHVNYGTVKRYHPHKIKV